MTGASETDEHSSSTSSLRRIALLGNHLPRHCGIATFTSDLTDTIIAGYPSLECAVVAMNDAGRNYPYSERVRFEIAERDVKSYHRASDFLNVGGTEVLSLQHEYGIFGGRAGSHILTVLNDVRMPVVTTLHTILAEPTLDQRRVMDEITRLSNRLVVMSERGSELLQDVHGVRSEKIDVIPHGIPAPPSGDPHGRRRVDTERGTQLLTFGLLSPDKGIEYVIDALPAVVERYPKVVYVVVGATHPNVKAQYGEEYRRNLQLRAHRLGVNNHVVFHDRFVSAAELAEFVNEADIYLTPYLNPEQSTSGTLAYALGRGKVVVSTPYAYAKELLASERGVLVPMRDSSAIADALLRLIGDPTASETFGRRAAELGSDMSWPSVARQYVAAFERAHQDSATSRRSLFASSNTTRRPMELPELEFGHLHTLTDETGLLQHAAFTVPRYEDGYCLDDNARALLLMTMLEDCGAELPDATAALSARYLAFVRYAFDPKLGRFRNFMSYSRAWGEQFGSEDSHGRAVWALGAVVGRAREPGRKGVAGQLFHAALQAAERLQGPRSWAFALLGIHEYLRAFKGDRTIEKTQGVLAGRLLSSFEHNAEDDWPWCESMLTYDNARLPQALITSGADMGNEVMVATGLGALEWLTCVQRPNAGLFVPIGSNGFYPRGGQRATFDAQPLEACATVSACLDAWRVTGDERWDHEVWHAFSWFLGENALRIAVYDPTTGGCRDGLHPDRPNENQGAESTVSWLLALTDVASLESEQRIRRAPHPTLIGERT